MLLRSMCDNAKSRGQGLADLVGGCVPPLLGEAIGVTAAVDEPSQIALQTFVNDNAG